MERRRCKGADVGGAAVADGRHVGALRASEREACLHCAQLGHRHAVHHRERVGGRKRECNGRRLVDAWAWNVTGVSRQRTACRAVLQACTVGGVWSLAFFGRNSGALVGHVCGLKLLVPRCCAAVFLGVVRTSVQRRPRFSQPDSFFLVPSSSPLLPFAARPFLPCTCSTAVLPFIHLLHGPA